ncbi:MAG: LTA synthase family protein [Sodaliphilus sp.]
MKLLLTLLLNSLLLLYVHYDYILMGDGQLKERIYILSSLFSIGFDASIITLIVYTIRNKHVKMAVSGVFWLWCMVNVVYLRHFNTYVDITLIGELRNFDILGESILALVHWRDIIVSVLLLGAFYVVIYRLTDEKEWIKWYYMFIPIVLSFFGIYYANSRIQHTTVGKSLSWWNGNFGSNTYVTAYRYGFFHFFYSSLYTLNMHRSATEADTKAIQALEQQRAKEVSHYTGNASLPDNVIFILMESIVSDAVMAVCNADSVMPNLAKLAREAQYCNMNMTSETGIGWSSDGQLIYMSGLLQHSTKNTVNAFTHNAHRGLGSVCKRLGYATAMVIPTGKHVWHQQDMCRAYGIDSLYSTIKHGEDYDESLVDSTIQVLNTYKNRRAFITVLNISTHTPCSTHFSKRMHEFHDKKFGEEQLLFFERANYFDFHLGRLIAALRKNGQWNNSLIILASDHHADGWLDQAHARIPLIITGGFPLPMRSHDTAKIFQTDVYPTILGLLRVKQNWRGVGKDLFTPQSQRLSPQEKQRISDIILETDWFGANS